MTDQRLRELLEERVADLHPVDLVDGAWERAAVVRRRRHAVAGTAIAVLSIVGAATVVVSGRGGDVPPPPPASQSTDSAPVPKAERGSKYGGVPVWWAPTTGEEADLPQLTGSGLPERIDLSETEGEVPTGIRAVGLFQLWGEQPGEVVVVGADGSTYSLDASRLRPVHGSGNLPVPPLTQDSLSPDGRYAFFLQPSSLEVYDFDQAMWTTIPTRRAGYVEWSEDGASIRVPSVITSSPLVFLFSPSGESLGTTHGYDLYTGPKGDDDFYGPIKRLEDHGARGLNLAGPLMDPDGIPFQSIEAVGAGGDDEPEAVLVFPPSSILENRWNQCCPAVGWLDESTVLFESRHEDARILAWRVGAEYLYRVSDIRGWTPGEESYVASFAAVDGSVTPDPDPVEETATGDPDAEFQDIPIWWSPDVAGEADLPWLEQSVLPREIDVAAAVQTAPEVEPGSVPFDRAVAAFPYPSPRRPDWVVLVGPDHALGKLDARRLESWRDVNAPYDLATRTMLSPDGRHLVFPQDGYLWIVTVATGEWQRIDTGDDVSAYPIWVDSGHLLLRPEGSDVGALYTLEGRRVTGDAGASPVEIFDVEPTVANTEGPSKLSPNRLEAQVWRTGPAIPIPEEGSGRYLSAPKYLAIDGSEQMALAFVEEVDQARRVLGPVAAGWLDDETVVYESESEVGHLLIAWRINTREFWKVAEILGSPGLSYGSSFADLHH